MNQRETKLKTNFYDIALIPGKSIYEYVLEITDSTPELVLFALKQFKTQLKEELNDYMFINQNIYSPTIIKNLDEDKRKILGLMDCQRDCQYLVSIKLVQRLTSQDVQCGIVVAKLIKQLIRKQLQMVSVGRRGTKLFWSQKAFKFQKQNLEIWPGVECIYRPNLSNQYLPSLIVDCAFKVLRYRTALEEIKQNRNWQDQLRGQIVMTTYNKKFYKIDDIDVNLRPTSTFQNEKKEEITYQDYYKQRYNTIIHPNQPMIKAIIKENKIENGKREQGFNEKIIYLIPELCQLTGLSDELRNDFNAMKELAQVTKPCGDKRQQCAKEFISQVQASIILNRNTGVKKEVLKDWGLKINQECVEIAEKRIHPGNLIMGEKQKFDLSDKSTNLDRQTQTQMFSQPQKAIKWAIIYNKKTGANAFNSFVSNLRSASEEFKFFVLTSPFQQQIEDREEDLEGALKVLYNEAIKNDCKVDLIVFLLPGQKKKAKLYKSAKRLSMAIFGCSSQVVIEKTLEKNTRSIVNKILVQLNAKLGGIPWTIDGLPQIFQNEPTMICGVDIFAKSNKKSQLAFCSTTDKNFTQYYSQVVTSGEFSQHLQECLSAAMLAFKVANNGTYPKKVIIYRDGVGEGQETVVKSSEVPQYQQAISLVGEQIQLILIICDKRVSPKFYQRTQNGLQNPLPGTYVDDPKIVNDVQTDFYLISQICRQGTVTPTLYKILHSDIKGVEQSIKILTFKLCWLFYNFTGSIKIPAPVRYAHCLSNFIGDNYDEGDQIKFIPHKDLIAKRVLYYI